MRKTKCKECNGSGEIRTRIKPPEISDLKCTHCDGTGEISVYTIQELREGKVAIIEFTRADLITVIKRAGVYVDEDTLSGQLPFYFIMNGHYPIKNESEIDPMLRFKFTSMEEWERWAQKQAPDNMGTHRGAWLEGEWAGYSQCMVKEVKKRDDEISQLKKQLEETRQAAITQSNIATDRLNELYAKLEVREKEYCKCSEIAHNKIEDCKKCEVKEKPDFEKAAIDFDMLRNPDWENDPNGYRESILVRKAYQAGENKIWNEHVIPRDTKIKELETELKNRVMRSAE